MRKIITVTLATLSLNVFAGIVTNHSNSKKLTLECKAYNEANECKGFEILLTNNKNHETKVLAQVALKPYTNRPEDLVLREKLKPLKLIPLSNKAYVGDSEFANFGAGVTAVGLGVVALSALEVSLTPVGWGIAAAGLVIIASPAIVDVTTLPLRAFYKGLQIHHANQSEKYAFQAFLTLMNPDAELELSNMRFNRIVKAFDKITNIQ
jgi:hypothetical protein